MSLTRSDISLIREVARITLDEYAGDTWISASEAMRKMGVNAHKLKKLRDSGEVEARNKNNNVNSRNFEYLLSSVLEYKK